MLADLEEQRAAKRQEWNRLTLTSPVAGTVLPGGRPPDPGGTRELPIHAGTPLEEENVGCRLEQGDLFCLVGDPRRLEMVALVDQADIPRVRPGLNVRMLIAEAPGQVLEGRVVRVAQINRDDPPHELQAAGLIPFERRDGNLPRLLGNAYEVVIAFERQSPPLLIGATGWASVHTDPQSLGIRLYRAVRSTFRIPW